MSTKEAPRTRSIAARDSAVRRLRWLTLAAGLIAAAAMGLVAAVTAASTHARSVVKHALGTSSVTTPTATIISVPAPTATVSTAADVSASSASSSTPSASTAQSNVSSAASSAPVVVSGGS